ncbi:MAG: sigma 54-dependent Fis family transcriptional regulator [Deltaproteobacteria bacterium]|nr:sigma 54-dependent Fis family transcriptional regulator [Deltaproteobacteria bacterium]
MDPKLTLPADSASLSTEWVVEGIALEHIRDGGARERHALAADVVRIGSHPNCDVVVQGEPTVSRTHCEIARDLDGLRIRDLSSTNGVFVDGVRVFDALIRPGSVISLGNARLEVVAATPQRRTGLAPVPIFGDMVGRSPAMRHLFADLARVAPTDATVLITGETGTGKECVADEAVRHSKRKDKPFVVLDCSSLPANLIESELFGHVRGAFTGALMDRKGAFERADGGTIFLDELGELPLEQQPKLLRVLEKGEVRRLGDGVTRTVDVRVIAATNRDLATEVNRGRFREDLYYRLSVITVHVPALRMRKEDIPLLVEVFKAQVPGGEKVQFTSETLERFQQYDWPGNVRELRNVVERAIVLGETRPSPKATDSQRFSPAEAAAAVAAAQSAQPSAAASSGASGSVPPAAIAAASSSASSFSADAIDLEMPFKEQKSRLVDAWERVYLERLLEWAGGNVARAARRAGIDRVHLHKLISRHGIEVVRS